MIEKRYKIVITPAETEEIMEKLKVKRSTVYKALNFKDKSKRNSNKCIMIRNYATEKLGHVPFVIEYNVYNKKN